MSKWWMRSLGSKSKNKCDALEEWYEIGRYVTPYGVECGWSFDVTDYRSILKGEVPIYLILIPGYAQDGWLQLNFILFRVLLIMIIQQLEIFGTRIMLFMEMSLYL